MTTINYVNQFNSWTDYSASDLNGYPDYNFTTGEDDGILVITVNDYPIYMGNYDEFDGELTDELKEMAVYYYECAMN